MARKGINPAVAGLAGAAIGAATGIALSDKNTRNKIGRMAEGFRQKGEETYHEVKRRAVNKVKSKGKKR